MGLVAVTGNLVYPVAAERLQPELLKWAIRGGQVSSADGAQGHQEEAVGALRGAGDGGAGWRAGKGRENGVGVAADSNAEAKEPAVVEDAVYVGIVVIL